MRRALPGVLFGVIGAIYACVGEDPDRPQPPTTIIIETEGGTTSSGGSSSGSSSSSGSTDGGTLEEADAGDGGDGGRDLLVFVTKGTIKVEALGADIRNADAFCNAAADGGESVVAKPHGPFVAWLSTASEKAWARLSETGRWKDTDGKAVATYTTLSLGKVSASIERDETGAMAVGKNVWTATTASGSLGSNCNGWDASGLVTLGRSGEADKRWTELDQVTCTPNLAYYLYCFEQN